MQLADHTQSLLVAYAKSIYATLTVCRLSTFNGVACEKCRCRDRDCLAQKALSGGDLVPQRFVIYTAHRLANSMSPERKAEEFRGALSTKRGLGLWPGVRRSR